MVDQTKRPTKPTFEGNCTRRRSLAEKKLEKRGV